MITHPAALLLALACVAAGAAAFRVKYLPVPLWCYFIPTALSTAGVLPSESPLYGEMSRTLLPACLTLLLIGTDLPALAALGPRALIAMAAGALGIFAGGLATYPLAAARFPDLWKGWGCLAASWTGGSANMISVKEILGTPEELFSNLIIMDAMVAYTWMAFLIYISRYQETLDRYLKARPLEHVPVSEGRPAGTPGGRRGGVPACAGLALGSLVIGRFFWTASGSLPEFEPAVNRFTWTVILATAVPLALSLTPARKLDGLGAGRTGNFLLCLLLTSIGARADLSALLHSPAFLALGFVWVAAHGIVLAAAGRIFRIPSAALAAASQANVGGPVSAPIVASVYDPRLAPLGLLLAILGGICGTYAGLIFSEICRASGNLIKF